MVRTSARRWLLAARVLIPASLLGCSPTQTGPADTATRPPNIILIVADDLGAGELGCYGHPEHQTPHIDALAQDGVRFDTCYATPVCYPSRFQLLTGKYGHRTRTWNFMGRPGGPRVEDPESDITRHRTLGTLLRASGYATALAGKWQMSPRRSHRIEQSGFDEHCIWGIGNDIPRGLKLTSAGEDQSWRSEELREDSLAKVPSRYWHPSVLRNGEGIATKPTDYGPDLFTDFVMDFMDRHKDQPFFVYYPMVLTHAPYCATPDTASTVEEPHRHDPANYRSNVEHMDHLVGRIVQHLEQLAIRERTVVLFTGDNGTLDRGKAESNERGARVPLVVSGPGMVKRSQACEELVDFSDLLPTLADLAGAKAPRSDRIDGRSFAGVLRGEPVETREWVFSYLANRRVLRTRRWLLEENSPTDFGRLYDTGGRRDGEGYIEVSSTEPGEAQEIRRKFEAILATLPVPDV